MAFGEFDCFVGESSEQKEPRMAHGMTKEEIAVTDKRVNTCLSAAAALRLLQENLPWGVHDYSSEFLACSEPQRDAEHALKHIVKATGKLMELFEEFDHTDFTASHADSIRAATGKYLADLVICSLRVAGMFPFESIDMSQAFRDRITGKFSVLDEPSGDGK